MIPYRHRQNFPFLSLCGLEMNYVRAYDTPIVFQSLEEAKDGREGHVLTYVEGLFSVCPVCACVCMYLSPIPH